MLVHVYDPKRLILYKRYPPGAVATDNELAIELAARLAEDAATKPNAMATIIVSVDERSVPPDAGQRQRMAGHADRIPNHRYVFISRSPVARTVVTGIHWLTRTAAGAKRSAHSSYEEARAWLVENTSHSAGIFDEMHEEVCRREAAASIPPRRS
jgi:hypothetical protein